MLAFANGAFNLTKSDAVIYAPPLQGVYVGGAGNVTIVDPYGNNVTFTAPAVGSIIPCLISQVMAAGTTATLLVGLR